MIRFLSSSMASIGCLATAFPLMAQTAPVPTPMPAASTAAPAQPMNAAASDGYILGTNDEVEVSIFSSQSQTVKTRIKEDGTITVPFVGAVVARDRTARQLAQDISNKLRDGGYLVNPIVNVEVTQFVSNVVTVLGSVATPGLYPLDRELTVAMLVARAGGRRPDGADYALLKKAGSNEEHRIDFDSLVGQWSGATVLAAGDTVLIPDAPMYFAYGQINSPGTFPITSGMTIRQALARAGGPTLAGTQNNITLYRDEKRLKKVDLDTKIQPNDTIFVNERLF